MQVVFKFGSKNNPPANIFPLKWAVCFLLIIFSMNEKQEKFLVTCMTRKGKYELVVIKD